MISVELCIVLCTMGNRFILHTQWDSLGRNLHNFIWIVALINCSLSLSFFYFIACILLWHSKHSFYFFMWMFSLSPLLHPFPCSPAFDFSLIKLSASGYGFLSHYGSVCPGSILFTSFLSVFQRFSFASSTALWFVTHTTFPLSTAPRQKGSVLVSLESTFICCFAFARA